ncbi:MAG: hypothetical protein K9J30_12945 [Bacteroidales bacterium]|nr:hypothetical protein [Bacteroidales bacterium]
MPYTFPVKHILKPIFLSLVIVLPFSCEKPEGYGGTSRIHGKLVTSFYNDDYSLLLKEEAAVDEDVFLLFGEDEHVGDKVETSSSGAFQFPYLRPGAYTVYYMSEDSLSMDNEETPVSIDATIESGQDQDLGVLKRIETLDFDDGTSSISGTIRLINYKNSSEYPFLVVKDTSFAQEHEVYLTYGQHEFYDERIRTGFNGYFEFRNLIKGKFTIYTYSENVTGATEDIPVIFEVTITEEGEEIDLGVFDIYQL